MGWAAANEKVTVKFAGQEKSATAGADGKWMVKLDTMKASADAGKMTVTGADGKAITIDNAGQVFRRSRVPSTAGSTVENGSVA